MVRKSTGKGGDFDTRPNPFSNKNGRPKSAANLTEVGTFAKAVQLLIDAGCALIVGKTRDGGAVVLTILDGEERHRTYCSNDAELEDAVNAMIDMYEQM